MHDPLTPDEWAALPELIDAATPGPWETGCLCDPESTCRCRYIYGNDGRMGAVASVHLNVDEHDDNPTEPEAIANQRLIALAPSLARAALAERARAEAAAAQNEGLQRYCRSLNATLEKAQARLDDAIEGEAMERGEREARGAALEAMKADLAALRAERERLLRIEAAARGLATAVARERELRDDPRTLAITRALASAETAEALAVLRAALAPEGTA